MVDKNLPSLLMAVLKMETSRLLFFSLLVCKNAFAAVVLDVKPSKDGLAFVTSKIASTLAENNGNVDVTINLHPGSHSVPEGGLVLDHRHTPSEGHTVHWIGKGLASISGAIPVTGWKPSKANSSVYVAPAPSGLHGVSARQDDDRLYFLS